MLLRSRVVLAAFLPLLLLVGAASALADDGGQSSTLPPTYLSEYGELLESTGSDALGLATDPEAAEELPHRDLDREGALELLTSVFPEQLESPAGIFDDLEVEEFYSDHVAVIPAGQEPAVPSGGARSEQPGLLDSLLPLRTEDKEGDNAAVDLDLESAEGELQPANPLVEIGIPMQLGEGISLPEVGVEIELAGAPAERSPSTAEESTAFFPNVATDSDLTVAPTPTGVETLTQLRSPDAPRSQTFNLTLPAGASLQANGAGAEVVRDGQVLIGIPKPTALDAEGNSVPVSLEVDGSSLTVEASPSSAAAYPILVDPVYQAYSWSSIGDPAFGDWKASSGNPNFLATTMGIWGGQYGLNLKTQYAAVPPYMASSWDTFVPRFFTDYENAEIKKRPTSYIKNLTFSQLYFWIEEGAPVHPHPFFMVALTDEAKGLFVSSGTHNSAEGQYLSPSGPYTLVNPQGNLDVKHGGIALASYESIAYPRHVYVGQASVELTDNEAPTIGIHEAPTKWVNDKPSSAIGLAGSDPGLGISQVAIWETQIGTTNLRRVITPVGCIGTFSSACPRKWSSSEAGKPPVNYEPQVMPQGEDWVALEMCDPVVHCSPETCDLAGHCKLEQSNVVQVKVKVDHTAPTLALSGTMTEQGSLGTQKAQYTVKASATDGTEAQPQSGIAKIEIKVDGKPISLDSTWSPGCATKNCPLPKEWTLNADQYAAGQHKVEVIATDAVGLATTKSVTIETHPDLTAPTVALSGSITEQAQLGTTRPSYALKVSATDPGGAEERKSGAASTVVKVDGKTVDSYSPGCVAGGCAISREWSLQSSTYAAGAHLLQVTATDAAGKATTKSQTVNIARDTTAPQISATNLFYTAPEGWVEQKLAYSYNATASDPNGYGMTSLVLKVDGTVIKSVNQACPQGGCNESFGSNSIDMHPYAGGAHSAELAATDGAGNVARQKWTLNVDPAGQVSTEEAISTVEAMEDTTEEEVLASEPVAGEELPVELSEEELEPEIVQEGEDLQTIGAPTETEMTVDPGDGFTIHAPEGDYSVVPVGGGSANNSISDGRAVIAPNTHGSVDSIVRPTYEGDMTFQLIRDTSAPEEYSWRVQLGPEDTLTQVDSTHAEVFTDGTVPTLGIRAVAAHDADGSEVPTTLAVGPENTIALIVHHRAGNPAAGGASFVYPISAGTGWLGGFQTFAVAMPAPEVVQNEEEEEGYEVSGTVISEWSIGAPEAATVAEASASGYSLTSQQKNEIEHRRFRYIGCQDIEDPVIDPGKLRTNVGRECGNPFAQDPGPDYIAFNMAIRGAYFRLPGVFTKHLGGPTDHIECDKMFDPSHYGGYQVEEKYFIDPARKCQWWGTTQYSRDPIAWNENGHSHHITPYGEWNWGSSAYANPEGHWTHHQTGLALYLWTSPRKYIGRHITTCIDC
jgi:hypothetical protein